MKPSWLDRTVAWVSPTAGLRRYQSRLKAELLMRNYEAASVGRRTQGWNASKLDATSTIAKGKGRVRDVARDLVRNNPFSTSALDALESNVIGDGIVTVFKNPDGTTNKELTGGFKRWAESTEADFMRTSTYFGLQALVLRSVVEGGEALALPMVEDGQNPRFCLKTLEPDFVDDLRVDYQKGGEIVVDGVVLDDKGRRKGFYLFDTHPGSINVLHTYPYQSKFYKAEDVFQVYRMERIGQLRGMSWFAPVTVLLKELDEMMDATLVKQKIAAAFAAFVRDLEMTGTGIVGTAKHELGTHIEPGLVEVLPPGKDVTFANPPSATDFDPFTRTMLRAYSVGIKVPYEVVTGDLSGVNFSSMKIGWQEFGRKISQWHWNMLIPQFCDPVAKRWLAFQGVLGANIRGIYPVHIPPHRDMLDAGAETKATVDQIRSGIKTLPQAIREQGLDPMEVVKETAEFNKVMDKLGVVYDSDARKITKSGIAQSEKTEGEAGSEEGNDSGQ